MTAQAGYKVLLKIGDGGSPETFTAVGGLTLTTLNYKNNVLDATTVESGASRTLLDGGGISGAFISGSGMFTDSSAEVMLRTAAFTRGIKNYQISFGNGDVLSGAFQITVYQRSGHNAEEETYAIEMESSGPVTYTPH